jgi:hypothetical protein
MPRVDARSGPTRNLAGRTYQPIDHLIPRGVTTLDQHGFAATDQRLDTAERLEFGQVGRH